MLSLCVYCDLYDVGTLRMAMNAYDATTSVTHFCTILTMVVGSNPGYRKRFFSVK